MLLSCRLEEEGFWNRIPTLPAERSVVSPGKLSAAASHVVEGS